ncbi:hypothetical protein VNI00_017117 [Paramarasmius palmivorus]|uniref:Uncharacterized protein n=1 Tax=Paramarasmius palmivorus TaxID=297713 RepID=A0AAW0B8N6_9AGAR
MSYLEMSLLSSEVSCLDLLRQVIQDALSNAPRWHVSAQMAHETTASLPPKRYLAIIAGDLANYWPGKFQTMQSVLRSHSFESIWDFLDAFFAHCHEINALIIIVEKVLKPWAWKISPTDSKRLFGLPSSLYRQYIFEDQVIWMKLVQAVLTWTRQEWETVTRHPQCHIIACIMLLALQSDCYAQIEEAYFQEIKMHIHNEWLKPETPVYMSSPHQFLNLAVNSSRKEYLRNKNILPLDQLPVLERLISSIWAESEAEQQYRDVVTCLEQELERTLAYSDPPTTIQPWSQQAHTDATHILLVGDAFSVYHMLWRVFTRLTRGMRECVDTLMDVEDGWVWVKKLEEGLRWFECAEKAVRLLFVPSADTLIIQDTQSTYNLREAAHRALKDVVITPYLEDVKHTIQVWFAHEHEDSSPRFVIVTFTTLPSGFLSFHVRHIMLHPQRNDIGRIFSWYKTLGYHEQIIEWYITVVSNGYFEGRWIRPSPKHWRNADDLSLSFLDEVDSEVALHWGILDEKDRASLRQRLLRAGLLGQYSYCADIVLNGRG